MTDTDFEIFLTVPPGLEPTLLEEVRARGFASPEQIKGGVVIRGGWPDVWRANLELRGATKVLARFWSFRAFHLAQLDKRARKVPWHDILPKNEPVRVDVTCFKSKIYHAGAATQRIEKAIAEEHGATIAGDAEIRIKVRIDDNMCTFSIDTTGESLHKRGHKEAIGKAPMRETLAALFLRRCGYTGTEPVLDPMCGSGTFVIEAAEMAMGLQAGRARAFAFEKLANFDAVAFEAMKKAPTGACDLTFYGRDRNQGVIGMATANANRAGVGEICNFDTHAISDLKRPEGPAGLVIVNPPYGGRIGNKGQLYALYGSLGKVLKAQFSGWRVGIVTSEAGLARATDLTFVETSPPISHGGLKIRLHRTDPLP
ncbi:MAG: THUMP domain-containing class I SAM-dependent RNA methyltransferase [Halocynthiibacter sp.]